MFPLRGSPGALFAARSRASVPFARFSAAALLVLVALATTSRLRATPAEDARAAVYAKPQLPVATPEDGLRIWLNLRLCVGEYCTAPEEIHLARTFQTTSVLLRRGRVITRHRIGSSKMASSTGTNDHVLLIRPRNVSLMGGELLHPDGIVLPWASSAPDLAPGEVEVKLEGMLISFADVARPFATSWLRFRIEPPSAAHLPLTRLTSLVLRDATQLLRERGEQITEPAFHVTERVDAIFKGVSADGLYRFTSIGHLTEAKPRTHMAYELSLDSSGKLVEFTSHPVDAPGLGCYPRHPTGYTYRPDIRSRAAFGAALAARASAIWSCGQKIDTRDVRELYIELCGSRLHEASFESYLGIHRRYRYFPEHKSEFDTCIMKALARGLPSASETQLAILTIVKGRARVHWSRLSPSLPANWRPEYARDDSEPGWRVAARSQPVETRYEALFGSRCH